MVAENWQKTFRRTARATAVISCAVLFIFFAACGGSPVPEAQLKQDLSAQIEMLATLDALDAHAAIERRKTGAELPGKSDRKIIDVPFDAQVRARVPLRNYVQYARELKHRREFVGWVKENSVTAEGRQRLRAFSLLANLARASAKWYDVQPDESFAIQGVLRYEAGPSGPEFVALVEGP